MVTVVAHSLGIVLPILVWAESDGVPVLLLGSDINDVGVHNGFLVKDFIVFLDFLLDFLGLDLDVFTNLLCVLVEVLL